MADAEEEQLARALAASLADQKQQRHRQVARTDEEEQLALSLALAASLADQEEQAAGERGALGVAARVLWSPLQRPQPFCWPASCTAGASRSRTVHAGAATAAVNLYRVSCIMLSWFIFLSCLVLYCIESSNMSRELTPHQLPCTLTAVAAIAQCQLCCSS